MNDDVIMLVMAVIIVSLYVAYMIYYVAYSSLKKKYATFSEQHEAFMKKTVVERDISLSTTDQLLRELIIRSETLIMIRGQSKPENSEKIINIHVLGIPPAVALEQLGVASQAIMRQVPDTTWGLNNESDA